MNKVGIKKIGFADVNDVDDHWTAPAQEEDPERGGITLTYFGSIDQEASNLSEELEDDTYNLLLQFTVRTEADRALAKRYERRPLVIQAFAVDGNTYTIGTKSYPAWFKPAKRRPGLDTIETVMTVEYQTLTGIL